MKWLKPSIPFRGALLGGQMVSDHNICGNQMGSFLSPLQLGYDVLLGAEAAIHSARYTRRTCPQIMFLPNWTLTMPLTWSGETRSLKQPVSTSQSFTLTCFPVVLPPPPSPLRKLFCFLLRVCSRVIHLDLCCSAQLSIH